MATHFKVAPQSLLEGGRGKVPDNVPRWFVMYIAQHSCGIKLGEIAAYLGLQRTGSIPTTIAKLRARMVEDAKLRRVVDKIKRKYDI